MLLLIDNYDSFSYNLYQLLGELLLESGRRNLQNPANPDIRVIRNDELSVEEIRNLRPEGIVISPGPGRPADAGVCEALVRAAAAEGSPLHENSASRNAGTDAAENASPGIRDDPSGPEKTEGFPPILGVCLGEQGICEALGATITYAKQLMHGKQSEVRLDLSSPLFAGLPATIPAARYHSLAVDAATLPESLKVIAVADDGEVMGVQHRTLPIYGVQFHPESIMTPDGKQILRNFLESTKQSGL